MSYFRTTEKSAIGDTGLVHICVKSQNLKGRGDMTVFEPKSALKNLPIIILLHGVYGSHWSWAFSGKAHEVAQSLIDDGTIVPMILVMPSDGLFGDGSGYLRHSGRDFEKWIVEDVVAAVRENCESASKKSALYISGLSMGGYGALRLGAKYAHLFEGISAHSSITQINELTEKFVEELMETYTENTESEELCPLFWMQKNKAVLPPLRFDCGSDDMLIESNRLFHKRLQENSIVHQYQEFPGAHTWDYWQQYLPNTLKFFTEVEQNKQRTHKENIMTEATLNSTDIDSHYKLTQEQIEFYRENEYIKLKQVLSPETIGLYKQEIWQKTFELNTNDLPMEERNTYDKAFIQVTNLWRESAKVKEFILGKTLGRIAAELMQVDGVRLYHDQALFKEPSGGITPWHADQFYWPLASEKTITAWIPLQSIAMDMGPLSFAAGSHKNTEFRNLGISDDSERLIQQAMDAFPTEVSPFDIGDISFHSGWMYHRAPANKSDKNRGVMTIIFMDEDMKLKRAANDFQQNDHANFCVGRSIGERADGELNPLIYSKAKCSDGVQF